MQRRGSSILVFVEEIVEFRSQSCFESRGGVLLQCVGSKLRCCNRQGSLIGYLTPLLFPGPAACLELKVDELELLHKIVSQSQTVTIPYTTVTLHKG